MVIFFDQALSGDYFNVIEAANYVVLASNTTIIIKPKNWLNRL